MRLAHVRNVSMIDLSNLREGVLNENLFRKTRLCDYIFPSCGVCLYDFRLAVIFKSNTPSENNRWDKYTMFVKKKLVQTLVEGK